MLLCRGLRKDQEASFDVSLKDAGPYHTRLPARSRDETELHDLASRQRGTIVLRAESALTHVHKPAPDFPRTQTGAELAERETHFARGGATKLPPLLLPVGRASRTLDHLFYPHECLDVLCQERSCVSRVWISVFRKRYPITKISQ